LEGFNAMRLLWVYPEYKSELMLPVMGKLVGIKREGKRPNAVMFTYSDLEALGKESDIIQLLWLTKLKNALAVGESYDKT
jgi:hypothetical protein